MRDPFLHVYHALFRSTLTNNCFALHFFWPSQGISSPCSLLIERRQGGGSSFQLWDLRSSIARYQIKSNLNDKIVIRRKLKSIQGFRANQALYRSSIRGGGRNSHVFAFLVKIIDNRLFVIFTMSNKFGRGTLSYLSPFFQRISSSWSNRVDLQVHRGGGEGGGEGTALAAVIAPPASCGSPRPTLAPAPTYAYPSINRFLMSGRCYLVGVSPPLQWSAHSPPIAHAQIKADPPGPQIKVPVSAHWMNARHKGTSIRPAVWLSACPHG